MVNTQKIIDDAEFLREAVNKLEWLLENKVITKKNFDQILEKLSEPYK